MQGQQQQQGGKGCGQINGNSNKRLAAQAQRSASDSKDDALSDDAIFTDPQKNVMMVIMKETMTRRRRKMVTMNRVVMKMNRAMRMTVMMRMGMRMTMRVTMRIVMKLMMMPTWANFMMMMKVMMILSRVGSTVYHLPVAKELDKSLILITHQSQTPMVCLKLRR
jgi:hypothetical protein